MAKRVAQMGGTASQVAAYVGIAKQFVVDTTNWRVHLMNGSTAGGVRLARYDELPSLSGYLTTTVANQTYLGINATAASATKATQDANGATIHTTYGTKAEVGQRVLANGDRGSLAGYETSGTSTTINASSPDSNEVGSAITVSNGSSRTSWTKVVRVTKAVTVTLGSSWVWQGGSAPTIVAGGVLVCCWCGSGGIANFVSPS